MMTREEACACAQTYIGTPYILGGRIKRGGLDCATFLASYLIEIGHSDESIWQLFPKAYKHDWWIHNNELGEQYLRALMRSCTKIAERIANGRMEEARPGCLALFKSNPHSTHYIHGGVILHAWPSKILHASYEGIQITPVIAHPLMGFKPCTIFDPWSALVPSR